jgi:tetratricopeptide (TPR) repeat protein
MSTIEAARKAVGARDWAEALRALSAVLAADPDHREALDHIGFVLFFLDRSAEALPYCRRAVELGPEHAYAWKGLGMHLVRLGEEEEGFAAIEQACTLKPAWFDPHWDYLVMCRATQSRERFDRMLALASARFPKEAPRLRKLGEGWR